MWVIYERNQNIHSSSVIQYCLRDHTQQDNGSEFETLSNVNVFLSLTFTYFSIELFGITITAYIILGINGPVFMSFRDPSSVLPQSLIIFLIFFIFI